MSGQVTLSQTAFDELIKKVEKVGKLEEQLKVLQERYEKLKHPEVVRSEIERL